MFISFYVNYKNIFIFLLILVAFVIGFIISRDFNEQSVTWLLHNESITYSPELDYAINSSKNLIDTFYAVLISTFKITEGFQIDLFYTITTILIYSFVGSLILMCIFVNNQFRFEFKKIILVFISGFCLSALGFVFTDYLWMIMFTLWLIHIHGLKQNELKSNAAIIVINSSVLAGSFFNINFLIIAVVANLIAIFISYRTKKEQATNYNVLMICSTLLMISFSLRNESYIGFIALAILVAIYIAYMFYKTTSVAYRINKSIDNFMFENANWLIIVTIFIITMTSVIYFLTTPDFKLFYDIWLLEKIGTPPELLPLWSREFIFVNSAFWAINVGIVIFALVNVKLSFSKDIFNSFNSKRRLSSPHLDWTILTTILFWNPISGNAFSILNNYQVTTFVPDFKVLFFMIACPVLLVTMKYLSQERKITYLYYSYISIIIATMSTFVIMINVF
ncbi:MAG: hypothetical protein ACRC42_05105 [Mycoplasma sp.]